jgi:hypothetical protein
VYAQLEILRNNKVINKNNQAMVTLSFKNDFGFSEEQLAKYLNVVKVKFLDINSTQITVNVADAKFVKCERC